jgi:hypothetical protein
MRRVFLFIMVFLVISLTALAQNTATIVGTVTDGSGAVIPGAKVNVSTPEKGFTRELESNAAGEYVAAKIPIGNYLVEADSPPFKKLARSGIPLAVGQTLRVGLILAVGPVAPEITVTRNAPTVETETAAVSHIVTGSQIANLELNGRNFVALADSVARRPQSSPCRQNFRQVGPQAKIIQTCCPTRRTTKDLTDSLSSRPPALPHARAPLGAAGSLSSFRISAIRAEVFSIHNIV